MPTKRVRNTGISWQGRYRDTSGKEHSKTFRTKREAKAWEDDQIRAVRRGEWLDPQTSTITVHDLVKKKLSQSAKPAAMACERTLTVQKTCAIELTILSSRLPIWLGRLRFQHVVQRAAAAPSAVARLWRDAGEVNGAPESNTMGASSIRIGGGPRPSPNLQIPHFEPCKFPNKASARPGMRLDWPRGHQRDHGRQLSSARRRPSHGSRARVDRRSHSGRPSWLRQDHDGSRARIVLHAARHAGGANGRRGRSASAARGASPRLLDEWQIVPQIWNLARREVDIHVARADKLVFRT